MRIALSHLRHAQTGGTERYLNLLAAFLAEAGHQVDILCRTHEQPPHPAVRFVPLRPWAIGRAHRLWSFATAVERQVLRESYDVVYGLGRTWSQDVVRLGGGTWALYLERAMPADRPRWQRLLGRDFWADRVALAIEQRVLNAGGRQLVVCNSQMIAREIQTRYGTETGRIRVIRNVVDCRRFHPGLRQQHRATQRARWGLAGDQTVILFLGSNYQRKGLDLLLCGLAAVVSRHPQARLAVVGYDAQQKDWRRRVAALGLTDRVVLAGGTRAVEACYGAADLYVLPTRYDPFANTTLEALACGLPVVTTDGNGGSEVLTPDCGTVLPWQGDVQAMTDALDRWLQSGIVVQAGPTARATAEANDLPQGMAASLAVLEEAARSRSPAGSTRF